MERVFHTAGYRNVELVTNPRDVRRRVETAEPDLILLDLTMPDMDGFEVLEAIQEVIPSSSYLPVIVITGLADNSTMLRALIAGATDFQKRPIDVVELMLRVRAQLETRFKFVALERELEVLRARRLG